MKSNVVNKKENYLTPCITSLDLITLEPSKVPTNPKISIIENSGNGNK